MWPPYRVVRLRWRNWLPHGSTSPDKWTAAELKASSGVSRLVVTPRSDSPGGTTGSEPACNSPHGEALCPYNWPAAGRSAAGFFVSCAVLRNTLGHRPF